jgi:uncharacterized protein (TIGR02271 family)
MKEFPMAQQTIVLHFDSRSDAQKARDALVQAGIGLSSIRMLPEAETTSYTRSSTTTAYDHGKDEGGFWASLGDLFLPDEDRYAYAEGMSRGGVTLAITAEGGQIDRVSEIAERHGAVDMAEREATWKREDWTGYTGGTAAGTSATASTRGASAASRGATEGEEVIPIAEENLRVGKRQVEGGRVKIRSYVVETPVQEQVNLRQEHVHVERRPVDRPAKMDEDYRERSIEAEERAEEAVVSKEARVKEELVVNKDVRERTEAVEDTVRRTEVELEDDRAGASRSGTTDTTRTDRTRR